MSFEPGDKVFRIADGHEVEIVSGPHRAYQVRHSDGTNAVVNQEELFSTIRAALDELPADAAYQYLDRDGDLWSGTPGGYYKYAERQNGFPGEWGLVLDYAELQRYYGPLTPVTE